MQINSYDESRNAASSYQYVLELRDRLNKTIKFAQVELERNQNCNKKVYNRKTKKKSISNGRQSFGVTSD